MTLSWHKEKTLQYTIFHISQTPVLLHYMETVEYALF